MLKVLGYETILNLMEKASLRHRKKYLMSWAKTLRSQHQRETKTSVLPLTLGQVLLAQLPKTWALDQQVPHI